MSPGRLYNLLYVSERLPSPHWSRNFSSLSAMCQLPLRSFYNLLRPGIWRRGSVPEFPERNVIPTPLGTNPPLVRHDRKQHPFFKLPNRVTVSSLDQLFCSKRRLFRVTTMRTRVLRIRQHCWHHQLPFSALLGDKLFSICSRLLFTLLGLEQFCQ